MLMRSMKQKGLTLIELLVGLVVGGIVVTGAVLAWGFFTRDSDYLIRNALLNQEMRALLQVITQDLRRAVRSDGKSAIELKCTDADLCDIDAEDPVVGNCVTFYASTGELNNGAATSNRASGFRLQDGDLEIWVSGDDPTETCANTDTRWQTLFSAGTNSVQTLRFLVSTDQSRCIDLFVAPVNPNEPPNGRCPSDAEEKVELLVLDVQLSGTAIVRQGATSTFNFNEVVKLRNDSIIQ